MIDCITSSLQCVVNSQYCLVQAVQQCSVILVQSLVAEECSGYQFKSKFSLALLSSFCLSRVMPADQMRQILDW